MTTRRLILMRHAKSSWAIDGQADHQRPLNKRGRRDAPLVARALSERDWLPDFVVSSDSERTRQTWAHMNSVLDLDCVIRWTHDLYLAGLGDLQHDADQWPNSARTVLALGHNPGWERALGQLGGDWGGMTTANAGLLIG
jgi:phosphohistidine phosphatase